MDIKSWTLRFASDGALCAWEHEDGLSGTKVIELAPIKALAADCLGMTDRSIEDINTDLRRILEIT